MRHFGPGIKNALNVAMVLRNVDPPYACCSNVREVLGKQLTKAIGPSG